MNKVNVLGEIKLSLIAAAALLVLLCGIYPLIVWGVAQVAFHHKANGSTLLNSEGKPIASLLLAQGFSSEKYFHTRPSKAGGGYDATSSGGSNWGPISQLLMDTVKARVEIYRQENELNVNIPIPGDAVMASASGLDPDISFENALLQAGRVAKARNFEPEKLKKLIADHVQDRDLGILGERRVNIMLLNRTLDQTQ
jgi:potassium-transporting ATPase KdpC subunit